MTLSELLTYVRRIHNAETDTYWSDEEIRKLVEAGSNEIISILGLIEAVDTSITTVDGTQSYAFPSNVVYVRRVYFDSEPLKLVTQRIFDTRDPTGSGVAGKPQEYFIWNNMIYLSPTPDEAKVLKLFVEKSQSSLTQNTDTIEIPSVLHYRLADFVIAHMYAKDMNQSMANMFMNRWLGSHIPAFKLFKRKNLRTGGARTVHDADSGLETDFGVN
jgi:hypothetical protein